MYIYIILVILILILGKRIKKNQYNIYDFILIAFMILMSGLRNGVGTDYEMYKKMYFFPNEMNFEKVEIGFKILIRVSNLIFKDSVCYFFIICSALTILPIYITIKKYSKRPGESIFYFVTLGFYTLTFNMIRQSIALAIIIFALRYMFENKKFKYMICVMIASLFHGTAIVMLPIYWISKMRLKKIKYYIIFIVFLSLGTMAGPIFNYVVNNIPQYSMYEEYVTYNDIYAGIGTYLVNLVYLILILLAIINKERIIKENENYLRIINTTVISVFFIALAMKNILFARMIYYLFVPIVIILPEYICVLKKKNRKYIQLVAVMFCMVFYMMNLYFFNGVYPYSSIFK